MENATEPPYGADVSPSVSRDENLEMEGEPEMSGEAHSGFLAAEELGETEASVRKGKPESFWKAWNRRLSVCGNVNERPVAQVLQHRHPERFLVG